MAINPTAIIPGELIWASCFSWYTDLRNFCGHHRVETESGMMYLVMFLGLLALVGKWH